MKKICMALLLFITASMCWGQVNNASLTGLVTDPSGAQEMQIRKKGDDYYAKSSAAEFTSRNASVLLS